MDDTNNEDNDIDIDNDDESSYMEEDGSGDKYVEIDEKTFQKLKKNDPAITHLYIQLFGGDNFEEFHFNDIDWIKDGDCIANNTHLKRLILDYQGNYLGSYWEQEYILGNEADHRMPTRHQLQDFFSCIYQNCSIKDIRISSISVNDEFGKKFIEGLCTHPSLVSLHISNSILESVGCSAVEKVLKHPMSKLKDLQLCQIDDDEMSSLCNALLGNSTLKKLDLSGNECITSVGWQALSTFLQSANCNLVELKLINGINHDEYAGVLGSGFRGSSVKILDLSSNKYISSAGWRMLLDHLSHNSIVSLNLMSNKIDDAGLSTLATIGTLKSLDLASNNSITALGWRSYFNTLQTRGTQLAKLGISSNNIGDEDVATLCRLLRNMTTLKTLNMSGMNYNYDSDEFNEITPRGWVSLFTTLQDSNLNLVELNLGENYIDDGGLQLLIRLVTRKSTLKYLSLRYVRGVTPAEWQSLSNYLQSPNFALKELDLDGTKIDDDTLVAFTRAISQNKTLKLLSLYNCTGYEEDDSGYEDEWDDEGDDSITERGWKAVSTLIYNKTSIMNTYNSNHTLCNLGLNQDGMDLPDDLISHLDLNKNKDKAEVARQKILQTHFSTEDNDTSNMQDLLDMELVVMPSAISWVGKSARVCWSGTSVSGLSLLYKLLRRLPDLFDSQKKPSTGKRKHGIL